MLKKAKRLTRRSYRRKLIMFGVSIFASLALTATGFAAWVLSTDAMRDAEGAVEVGAVAENSVTMSEIAIIENGQKIEETDETNFKALSVFRFEPREDDTSGMVKNDGEHFERMALTYQWTINNYQIVAEQFVLFKMPTSVYNAVSEGYLAMSSADAAFAVDTQDEDYVTLKLDISKKTGTDAQGELQWAVTDNGADVTATFQLTLKIDWGTKFDGQNPGVYFDSLPGATAAQAREQLIRFGATMHGLNYEDLKDLDEDALTAKYKENPLKYFVEVHANVG